MNVKEIETAIANLPPAELAELVRWFEEYHSQVWDAQIERDLNSGRLDALLEVVKQDYFGRLLK